MGKVHNYNLLINWTGNNGTGTSDYRAYSRNHDLIIEGKPVIQCSSDPAFRGDKSRFNPEEMLLSAIASCHMLWYLHLCADAGIKVIAYTDNATGIMEENDINGGKFTGVTLFPHVTITDTSMIEKANSLHKEANRLCFISNSCNFPIHHKPVCVAS